MNRASALLFILFSSFAFATLPASAQDTGDCNQQQTGGGEVLGTLLGAAVGGLVGSQIGKGTGNSVAIGAGVLAGGWLGNRMGAAMDCRDRQMHSSTAENSLETQKTGTTSTWNNPDTGHTGTFTPTQTYQQSDGTYCREFQQTITIDGQTQQGHGTACRQPDGSWKVVKSD